MGAAAVGVAGNSSVAVAVGVSVGAAAVGVAGNGSVAVAAGVSVGVGSTIVGVDSTTVGVSVVGMSVGISVGGVAVGVFSPCNNPSPGASIPSAACPLTGVIKLKSMMRMIKPLKNFWVKKEWFFMVVSSTTC
jgi:hypothetical protein